MELADDDSPVELGINAPATPEGDPASQALRRSLEEPSRTPRFADTLATEALTCSFPCLLAGGSGQVTPAVGCPETFSITPGDSPYLRCQRGV